MINWALKEWHAAISALMEGETLMLLRKGGISEKGGQFRLAARRALLLPTFEHQKPELLKPNLQARLGTPESIDNGEQVRFTGWAEITYVVPLNPPTIAYDLIPHLVWNRQFVQNRINWKPDRPLYGMVLRAYRFEEPVRLPHYSGFRGCRSWVELAQPVATHKSMPVLGKYAYQRKLEELLSLLSVPDSIQDEVETMVCKAAWRSDVS